MRVFATIIVAGALFLGPPSLAQESSAVTVELSNFHFTPAAIALQHGHRYRLRLVNTSSGGHNFKAPAFFAASSVASPGSGRIAGGAVEVHGRETVELDIIPQRAGHYSVKCSHFLHSGMGMKGEITVS